MPGPTRTSSKKAGLPPGTLMHIGEKSAEDVKITLFDYDGKNFEEKELENIEESFPFFDKSTVTWLNIEGLHEVEVIEKIGKKLKLHPLLQEDILNTEQRPKMEDTGDYVFVVLRMLYQTTLKEDRARQREGGVKLKDEKVKLKEGEEEAEVVRGEQVSIVLGKNVVVSFQEQKGDVFDSIRERIRASRGRIRNMGADYLAYTLLDAIVDNYFAILENVSDSIEDLEEDLINDPDIETLGRIHAFKKDMIFLRKSIWPLREVVRKLERTESDLIEKATVAYLQDVYDHTIQVIDTVETLRDLLSGMVEIYVSSISNRMNEVMKVLTIIATIFIPLSFIAGLYGMNFENMPEVEWKFGYAAVLSVMAAVALGMLMFFRRRKWL